MFAVIVIQEAHVNGFKFDSPQSAALLEFIYRFGTNSVRYGIAFQCLYTSLAHGSLKPAYEMFLRYFDAGKQALPVFFIQVQEKTKANIKAVFINFLQGLFQKIDQIDHISDKENFNRHACMIVSSMISCNFLEDLVPMIDNFMDKVDMLKCASSARFSKSAIEISKLFKDQETAPLYAIARNMIKESVLMALDRDKFIDHGSVIYNLKHNQQEIYKIYQSQLSSEAKEKLEEILEVYYSYFTVISDIKS